MARPGVRGTFSQPGPSRPAAAVRLARTLGLTIAAKWRSISRKNTLNDSVYYASLVSLPLVLLLVGCGGGAGSDTTCASFTYQEDAQANYAKHLDADSDGIACEALPRRPTSTTPQPGANPGTPSTPTPPITVTRSLEFNDTFGRSPLVEALSDGRYRFSASAFYSPIGVSYQSALLRADEAITLTPTQFSYFPAFPDLYLSRFPQAFGISHGIAFVQPGILKVSLATDYLLIGRRCTSDSRDQCTLIVGTARIGSTGSFDFCPQATYTDSCASRISFQIDAQAGPATQFVFTPDSFRFGSLRAASTTTSAISVAMNINSDVYSLFGQPVGRSAYISSGVYRLTGISASGGATTELANITTSPHPSIPRLNIGSGGQLYLLGDSGLLVTGTQSIGSASSSLIFQRLR